MKLLSELGQAQQQLGLDAQKFWFVEMFDWFGLSTVSVESFYLGSGVLHFGYDDNGRTFVGLMFSLMKLKLNSSQQSFIRDYVTPSWSKLDHCCQRIDLKNTFKVGGGGGQFRLIVL